MTKPVCSHVLASSAWTRRLIKSVVKKPEPRLQRHVCACKANSSPQSFPSQTIPDFIIRYIIGVFCYNFKSLTNIFAPY